MSKLFFVTTIEPGDTWSGTHFAYVVKASDAEDAKTKIINGNGLPESERQFIDAKLIEFPVGSSIVLVGTFAYGD